MKSGSQKRPGVAKAVFVGAAAAALGTTPTAAIEATAIYRTMTTAIDHRKVIPCPLASVAISLCSLDSFVDPHFQRGVAGSVPALEDVFFKDVIFSIYRSIFLIITCMCLIALRRSVFSATG